MKWKFCAIPLGGYVKFFGDRNVFSYAEQEEVIKNLMKMIEKNFFYLNLSIKDQ